MNIELPDFALVVLVGASGSGKSTFAARHFLPTEILSSDRFRGLVADDEASQEATKDAFDALHHLASIRLRRRRLTLIDATNVQDGARKPLLALAHEHHAVPVAVVLDVPEKVCLARNANRPDRDFGKHVVERHVKELRRSLKNLRREGFRYVWHLDGEAQIEAATFTRAPLWTDKRNETGPFDLIGDIHGCYEELLALLTRLGYAPDTTAVWRHPSGRRLVFLGDLVDRGPKVVETAKLMMNAVEAGAAFCVPGNHDDKLLRALRGRKVTIAHGLDKSLEQIAALPEEEREAFMARFISFADGLVSHLWLDSGNLVAAHAGMKETMQGRASGRVRDFALYGETTGETDEFGLPVRYNWAGEYRGHASVVYGHTPVPAPQWLNNTINLDTGCVFGGALTALRWPEKELVSVPAYATYAEPVRPFATLNTPVPVSAEGADSDGVSTPSSSLQWQHDDLLDVADYTGRRTIETRLGGNVVVAEGNAAAALEVMSRFAAHPRWLLYLPPTMSPVETATDGGYLEHPQEAFAYFTKRGVGRVVCQEKHMGSRAVLVVCKNADTARLRFGADGETGAILTRTGRPFFDDKATTEVLLGEAARALGAAGLWEELGTDWCVLDAEIMPWNAKAQGLLREQYAPVASAGRATLQAELAAVEAGTARKLPGMEEMTARLRQRLADLEAYTVAYGRYCWDVFSPSDLKIAPFHLLAGEGRTLLDHNHEWHITTLARLADHAPLFVRTDTLSVDTGDADSVAAGVSWWEAKTWVGGEGMVVKPLDFLPAPKCQPAIKVRGREYLRIIYGPHYTEAENLSRLRERSLNAKRGLASREFALGVEGLERFVNREPLRRVHECAFGVLAMESEPVDPRL